MNVDHLFRTFDCSTSLNIAAILQQKHPIHRTAYKQRLVNILRTIMARNDVVIHAILDYSLGYYTPLIPTF
jgi:hypothetical protein